MHPYSTDKSSHCRIRGRLTNGFEYAIQPNTQPPKSFEAYLEVRAGSINEEEHERGIAHMLEHCVFLGLLLSFVFSLSLCDEFDVGIGSEKYPTSESMQKALTQLGSVLVFLRGMLDF